MFSIFLYFHLYILVVADIGGYLGLFLGCSLISIVEVLFFIVLKIFSSVKKLLKLQGANDDDRQETSTDNEIEIIKNQLVDMKNQFANMQSSIQALSEENIIIRNELARIQMGSSKSLEVEPKMPKNHQIEMAGLSLSIDVLEMITKH